jgi:formate hydrogenlyase subunit 6/NADH:ubiquinone oxidoreductase subunit I
VKAEIKHKPELCTGCRICALACSFAFFKVFNPEKAYLEFIVDEERAAFSMRTKEGCIACRICSDICPFDAIERIENMGEGE